MRVLIVTGQSTGGIWHYACCLADALAASVEVAIATPFPFEPVEGIRNIPIWRVGIRTTELRPLPAYSARRVISHVDKLRQLHRAIVAFRPNVVHLQDRFGRFDFAYLRLLRKLGIGVVFTAHDVRSLFGKSTWFDRARYREADVVLAHSSNSVAELVADGIERGKIALLPHANYLRFSNATTPSSRESKNELGLPPDSRSILFFGSIAPYKGLSVLIDAVAQLRQEDPSVYLLIAGAPKEDFEPYRHKIELLKLREHVITDLRYIPLKEFGKFFSAADVVALPHQRIYQSGVLQLAYAFGRPLAVMDVGGLGESVAEDNTGLVARTTDATGMASAIRALLSDPARAEEMGRRGRRLAATKYSWQRVARRILEIYSSLDVVSPLVDCRNGTSCLNQHEER